MIYWKSSVTEGKPQGWDKPNCRWRLSPDESLGLVEGSLSIPDYQDLKKAAGVEFLGYEEAEVLFEAWGRPKWHYPGEMDKNGYCSIADMRSLGITQEAMSDEQLKTAIERAVVKINGFCNRGFFLRPKSLVMDGDGTPVLFLEDWPIHEITSLKMDGRLIEARCYRIYGEFGYIKYDGCFDKGLGNIELSGSFGYAELPGEVRLACILITINELRKNKTIDLDREAGMGTENAIGLKRVKVEDIAIEYEYPAAVKNSLRSTTGVAEADAILFKYKKDIEACAV